MVSVKGILQEKTFFIVFSMSVFTLFYMLISSNGFVLGNDPSVHLTKALEMSNGARIIPSELAWYPPLYRILLAVFITFTNASRLEHAVFLMKLLTAVFDWLLVLVVYLLGRRLSPECGFMAFALLLLCFPFYEINFWGGYSSLLSIIFLYLTLLYLPSKNMNLQHAALIFILTFSSILTHQFTTFIAILIIGPYLLISFVAFKASIKKSLITAILGVSAAFLMWYLPVILPHINVLFEHTFISQRQYLYLVWRVTYDVFYLNFGWVLFLSFAGLVVAFHMCKRNDDVALYVLLLLGFIIPLMFTQSYRVGLMLPYDRFVYYLMPCAVVLASSVICLFVRFAVFSVKMTGVTLRSCLSVLLAILLIGILLASRFPTLPDKISEATSYYSYMDASGYRASQWLLNNFPCESAVVTTEKPGIFFGLMSQKKPFMEINPLVERSAIAETVLTLAFELEHPFTLYRVFEVPMPYELDQYSVSIHNLWRRVIFLYPEDTKVSYVVDGAQHSKLLSDLSKRIFWREDCNRNALCIQYTVDEDFYLTQMIEIVNGSIPFKVTWFFACGDEHFRELSILLSLHFDLNFAFNVTYIPGILQWENPLKKALPFMVEGRNWTTYNFSPADLPEDYVVFRDPVKGVYCALKFDDVPCLASIGVLSTGQIDAFRLNYSSKIVDEFAFSYRLLTFSEESFREFSLQNFKDLFNVQTGIPFYSRDYVTLIKTHKVKFLAFERCRFRNELINSGLLQLVYSTDNYVICKIKQFSD